MTANETRTAVLPALRGRKDDPAQTTERRLIMPSDRLFDRLTRPGATMYVNNGDPTWPFHPVPDDLQNTLRAARRVVADEVSEWYWSSSQSLWSPYDQHSFGPLRHPFPEHGLWIEWTVPPDLNIGGQIQHRKQGRNAGVLLTSTSTSAARRLKDEPWPVGTVELLHWSLIHNARPRAMPIAEPLGGIFGIAENGRPTADGAPDYPLEVLKKHSENKKWVLEQYRQVWDEYKVALLALSLMNCKNTGYDHHEPVSHPRSSKPHLRKRFPGLSYSTIRLPVPASASRSAKLAAAGAEIPRHLVRGHFKTYTADAPLLGRNVGTYWWGWQVRGNAEHGTVESSYDVRPKRKPDRE